MSATEVAADLREVLEWYRSYPVPIAMKERHDRLEALADSFDQGEWTHVSADDLRLAFGPSGGGQAQAEAMTRVMAVLWNAGSLADRRPAEEAVLDAAVAWYEASITEDVWDYELHEAVRVYREGQ